MLIKVKYTLSEQGRAEAVRRGLPAQETQCVEGEVDESALDIPGVRVTLAGEVEITQSSLFAKRGGPRVNNFLHRDAPFVDAAEAVSAVRDLWSEIAEEDAKKAKEKAAQHEAAVAKYLGAQVEDVIREVYPGDWRPDAHMPQDARLVDLHSAARAECKRRDAAHRAARDAEAAAEAAAKAEWIHKHGSVRLRRALEEGIECHAIYRDERLAIDRPGWRRELEVPGEASAPRNPPLEAYRVLDAAREVDPEASLRYWTVDHNCDESCYGDDCPQYDYTGYVAQSWFLGDLIIWGGPEDDDDDDDE